MLAHEFETQLRADHTLAVPEEIASRIPPGRPLRVIVLFQDTTEDEDWRRLTMEQFFKGYGDGDAIYDELSTG
jgi:hypothetical protein